MVITSKKRILTMHGCVNRTVTGNEYADARPAQLSFGHGPLIRGAIIAALGGLLFGFDTAVISGTTEALQKMFGLSQLWLGFTVAVAMIGTMAGSFAVSVPTDKYGRKKALFALAVGFFVSAVGCGLARTWWEFLVARFIGGLAIGGTSVVAPMYIAEISPPHLRGRLVAVNQLNIVIGILVSFTSNYLLSSFLDFDVAWRWMLSVLAFPAAIFFMLLFTVPESPRWLVKIGRSADARKALYRLGNENVEGELTAIQASLGENSGISRDKLFQRCYRRPILLACTLAVFSQFTGINALMYYAPSIFGMAGATRDSALLQSIAIGGTLFLFTIVAMFCIDRFGRRILLLIGSVGMAACLSLVAVVMTKGANGNGSLLLGALIGFIAFSMGAVTWVFISEIFPNRVRAKGLALGCFVCWSTTAAVSWLFPVIAEISGTIIFGFFAAMMVLLFAFVWKIMPETKGDALEDIEKQLTIGNNKECQA